MSTAKPIVLIKVDMQADFGNGKKPELYKLWEAVSDRMPDYHVFVIPQKYDPSEPKEVFEFQVFYDKDFTDIDYKALSILIKESLN